MRADLTITPPIWMRGDAVRTIMTILNHDDVNALFVGGCIRNELLKHPVKDIDIACKFTPNKTIELLNQQGIKTIPTGIKHGTITAIMGDQLFEITSLRSDVNTDGRHADVAFGANWADDARRRDFTINALYADLSGHIYDPIGQGLNDIQAGIVRFIGDAESRIAEDYLRILRFFRFYGRYGNGPIDQKSFDACKTLADKIETLSRERIADELQKIMEHDSAAKTIDAMAQAGIFDIEPDQASILSRLTTMQSQLESVNVYSRIYTINKTIKYFNNNKLKEFIDKLNKLKLWWPNHKNPAKALYHFGRDITVQGLLILQAEGAHIDDIHISMALSGAIPVMPVTADDIMQHFKIGEGPDVGQHLKRAETLWLDSDMTLKTQEILSRL